MKLGNLSIDKIYVETTEIPKVYLGNTVVYEQSGPAPVLLDYLRFIVKSDGVIYWINEGSSMPATTIEYSLDSGETWNSITSARYSAPTISVSSGDTVLFRGNNAQYAVDRNVDVSFSGTTCQFDVEGNIMSLVYGDNFSGETTLESAFTFHRLFQCCTGLTNAENLVLPTTTLSDSCYRNMFRNCTSLVSVPTLPATQLEQRCYMYMYEGCSSLNNIPSNYLPATVLSISGYTGMFSMCSSLTTAPELPATTLVEACYYQMFYGCTSLNYIKCLATTNIDGWNTYEWVRNVATSGTFVKASGANWPTSGARGIPSGWTTIDILSCSPSAMTISATSGTYQITVSSLDNPWSATTNDNWLTINPSTGGTGNTTVTVSVSENTGLSNRTSNISITDGIADVTCQITQNFDRKNKYLTFVIINDGDINWRDNKQSATYTGKTIEYSINNGSWSSITSASGTAAPTISVSEGDVIRFRGNNSNYALDNNNYYTYFGSTGTTAQFEVEGNIMSLLYGDNFIGQTTISDNFVFACLFKYCNVISAENLVLPATTLTASAYRAMFSNCNRLTSAPELPATTLADSCYKFMFENCNVLTSAPELPATVAQSCYSGMFFGCTSLTTAPELPSLTTAQQCYEKMFSGCTELETAPELPADVLVTSAYTGMFGGCRSLNYIKCLATDLSGASCTKNWVQNVSLSGIFVKHQNADWSGLTGSNGIPSGWAVEDAT